MRAVIIIICVALALPNFQGLIHYADWKVNNDYYSNVLCENQDLPELACKGKCAFMKKIKAHEEKKKNNKSINIEIKQVQLFDECASLNLSPIRLLYNYQYWWKVFNTTSEYIAFDFKPPRF